MTNADWGGVLVVAGLISEVVAIIVAVSARHQSSEIVKRLNRDVSHNQTRLGESWEKVIEALIAKLPWVAVMGVLTIILGMVLLMNRWPWWAPPS